MVMVEANKPLQLKEIDKPKPQPHQVLIRVHVCGVCRTDLHIFDGDLPTPKLPLVLGHQIIGVVEELGKEVLGIKVGDRVGVPWLGSSCGHCHYCTSKHENLCDSALYTGYQIDGGYADYAVSDSRYTFPIPPSYDEVAAAPLLCAGLIGYRALSMTGESKRIGFYGFGGSAHILIQVVNHEEGEVYVFTRKESVDSQNFAKDLGAIWVGHSDELPPVPLDAAIIFAPVGALIPSALKAVKKGGVVVCAGIHMSEIPSFSYDLLWEERVVRSVANLTRKDGEEFLKLAPKIPIKTETHLYPLERANEALDDLRAGRFKGSAVLQIREET
ncbi:MAG: putative alcohol dehydrogenase AdhA [Chlamydiales bacterium]|nr:putative alcohol dehydrogenase AdhA [Chlamydiales bacterium]